MAEDARNQGSEKIKEKEVEQLQPQVTKPRGRPRKEIIVSEPEGETTASQTVAASVNLGRKPQQKERVTKKELKEKRVQQLRYSIAANPTQVQMPRERKPRKLKPAEECSARTLRRRRKALKELKQQLGVDDSLTVPEAATMKISAKLTQRQYQRLRNEAKDIYPSLSAVRAYLKEIHDAVFNEMVPANNPDESNNS
uniref:Uncharacterized protein n=1 Tax=Panagrolaimus sp. JU765 TaxID=591449 RepID=A0AC34RTA2_9BILA